MNGSVSNLCAFPESVVRLRRELKAGRFDVVHVHEPITPMVGWDTPCFDDAPVVGTFHAYSTQWLPNTIATLLGARRIFNKLHARIAVSDAARWTGERFFGGHYTVIPNGVDVSAAPVGEKPPSEDFRILFVGRADDRKGLPVLLSAFSGLREHVPARLELIGASTEAVEPYSRSCTVAPMTSSSWAAWATTSCGAGCTRPTCSALLRSVERASAWC